MVDYRGPIFIRPFAQQFEWPIFNRVTSIECRVTNIADSAIDRRIVNEFKELDNVRFTLHNKDSLDVSDRDMFNSNVPDCRVSKVVETGGTLDINTKRGLLGFVCTD